MNTSMLKGEIVTKYGTQKRFASEIKWPENKVSRLMAGKYVPDIQDVNMISNALDFSADKIIQIFLR